MIWWVKPNHNTCCSHLMTKPTKWHVRPAKTHFVGFVMRWFIYRMKSHKILLYGISAITQSNQMVTNTQNNKMACAPSKGSDQPGHPPSLIRVFAVRMKKAWVLSYPLSTQRRLIRLGVWPRSTWVLTGRTVILLVLSWGGSYFNHYIYRNIDDIV